MGCQRCRAEWRMRVSAQRKFCARCKIDHRRKRGTRPLEDYLADKRKRAQTLVPIILQMKREGRTYTEIGAALGLSRNAAIGLMHRANANVK